MDLIYTDASWKDLGVLKDFELDMAYGSDENDFSLTTSAGGYRLEPHALIYVEGTEFGGIIDKIEADTQADTITYSGRTWHGLINGHIVPPNSGEDYLVLTGPIFNITGVLVIYIGLRELFVVKPEPTGTAFDNYQVPRYCGGYDAIVGALKSVGFRPAFVWEDGKVSIYLEPCRSYEMDELKDVHVRSEKVYQGPNYVIALGRGELKDRTVVQVSDPTVSSIDRWQVVLDLPNIESVEELRKAANDKLAEYRQDGTAEVIVGPNAPAFGIGDRITVVDPITMQEVTAEVVKKIVTIRRGEVDISYKIGE